MLHLARATLAPGNLPAATSTSRSESRAGVCAGGRAAHQRTFPYYNLAMPGGGLMLAVGWPGQWATTFARDARRGLRITAGQELTHLLSQAGRGDPHAAGGLAVLARQRHRAGAEPLAALDARPTTCPARPTASPRADPPCGNNLDGVQQMCNADNENKKSSSTATPRPASRSTTGGWTPAGIPAADGGNTGTWEPDPKRFPQGLRADQRLAARQGVKTHRLVRAGARAAANLAGQEPSRVASCGRHAAGPGQSRGLALADRPHRQAAHRAGHRPLPPGLQHGPARRLAGGNDARIAKA